VEQERVSLHKSKVTIDKLNNGSYEYHYFGASIVTVADLVVMAALSIINVGSVNSLLSETYILGFYTNCGQYLVKVNILLILKSLYSQFHIYLTECKTHVARSCYK